MVAVHLRAGVDGQVVGEHGRGQQPRRLLGRAQLRWAVPGGPVDPLPGPPSAPGLRGALGSRASRNA